MDKLVHTSDGKLKLDFIPSFDTPGTRVKRVKNSGYGTSPHIDIGDTGTIRAKCNKHIATDAIHVRPDKYPDRCGHYLRNCFEIITE